MHANDDATRAKRRYIRYAWMGSFSLVFLFIGLFMGIMILAAKGTEVFEGIPPSPSKMLLLQALFALFVILSTILGIAVVHGVRNAGREGRSTTRLPSGSREDQKEQSTS